MQVEPACCTSGTAETCSAAEGEHPSPQRFIIRLVDYQPLADAQQYVSSALTGVPQWSMAHRAEHAYTFDTDFVVLEAPPSAEARLREALAQQRRVRDVHHDRVVRRPLLHDEEEVPGPKGSLVSDEDGSVSKRRGRLSTAWSWGDGSQHSHASAQPHQADVVQQRFEAHQRHIRSCNATLQQHSAAAHAETDAAADQAPFPAEHHRLWGDMLHDCDSDAGAGQLTHQRKLLMGNQVSAALGAGALWDQGFKGQGIHVGAHPPHMLSARWHIARACSTRRLCRSATAPGLM